MRYAIDLLVQLTLTNKYDRSPMVTADNVFILLKKRTKNGWQAAQPCRTV